MNRTFTPEKLSLYRSGHLLQIGNLAFAVFTACMLFSAPVFAVRHLGRWYWLTTVLLIAFAFLNTGGIKRKTARIGAGILSLTGIVCFFILRTDHMMQYALSAYLAGSALALFFSPARTGKINRGLDILAAILLLVILELFIFSLRSDFLGSVPFYGTALLALILIDLGHVLPTHAQK